MPFKNEHIWIIGASSGIGAALARELARQGATLVLSARRQEELLRLNEELGGHHRVYALDVANEKQVNETADAIASQLGRIDRVIFLAAVYHPAPIAGMDMAKARMHVDVNIMGAIYCSAAALKIFDRQRFGQLCLCSSIAAYTGLPDGQPYSATKAAVTNFAESLYAEAEPYVDIKLISPGFVHTPMTAMNDFDMPFCIAPEQAAKAIATGLRRRAFEIHFPRKFTYLLKILRLLPYALALRITRSTKRKDSSK